MRNSVRILVKKEDVTYIFVFVEQDVWKFETLCDLYDKLRITCCDLL
jgi:hypothetical protein